MEGTADFGGVGMGWGGWGREDKMSVRGGQFQELWVSEQLNHELANPPPHAWLGCEAPSPPPGTRQNCPTLPLRSTPPHPPGLLPSGLHIPPPTRSPLPLPLG